MLYAMVNGEKRTASPNQTGLCAACAGQMIAKCGEIKQWHWAHRDISRCDQWHESETAWHLAWKSLFPAEWCETPIVIGGKMHIADVQRPDGLVIEFQHSPISPETIREREVFYGKMIWVFDVIEAYSADRFLPKRKGTYWTFRWKHCRTSLSAVNKPIFLDLGNRLFHMKKLHSAAPVGGWGFILDREQFLQERIS